MFFYTYFKIIIKLVYLLYIRTSFHLSVCVFDSTGNGTLRNTEFFYTIKVHYVYFRKKTQLKMGRYAKNKGKHHRGVALQRLQPVPSGPTAMFADVSVATIRGVSLASSG